MKRWAFFKAIEQRSDDGEWQQRRNGRRRKIRPLLTNADELPARERAQFAKRGFETGRRLPGGKVVAIDPEFRQQCCRQIKLTPRDLERKRPQQVCNRVSHPCDWYLRLGLLRLAQPGTADAEIDQD